MKVIPSALPDPTPLAWTKTLFRVRLPDALIFAGALLAASSCAVRAEEPMPFPPAAPGEADHTPPKLLHRVEPPYPAGVRGESTERRVYVAFLVDGSGKVRKASAMFDPPAPFAQAAVAAVEQWTFEPGRLRGRPIWTQMTVALYFLPSSQPEKR